VATDEAFRMEAGRRFHDLAAAAGNERSPRVDRCVGGTVDGVDVSDSQLCNQVRAARKPAE